MKSNYNLKINIYALSIVALSLSLILGYIEMLIPFNIGLTGVKLGLSNIITLITLKILKIRQVVIINVLRLVIIGVLFGNFMRFLISVSGFVFAILIMILSIKILNFRIITSSILGGVFHNIGQVFMVAILTKNIQIFRLLYIYIIIGALAGVLIGIISEMCFKSISKVAFEY